MLQRVVRMAYVGFWRQWQLITATARNRNYELKKRNSVLNFSLFGSII